MNQYDKELEKEQEKEEKKVRRTFISLILVTILVLTVLGLSFATFQQGHEGGKKNTITTQNISMNYTEQNGITIVNAVPIADSVGKLLSGTGEYFDFSISATLADNTSVRYEIAAMKEKDSTIPDENMKLYLEQQVSGSYEEAMPPTTYTPLKEQSEIGSPVGSMKLKTVEKTESGVDNYRLRMWIKEGATIESSQVYTVKVNVYGKAQ